MIKVEEKKDSSKEEQLQKMGQLINRNDNEPGEVLVEERGAVVTRAASHQQKGCHIKHLTLCIAQALLQAATGAQGSLPLAKQGYTYPEGLLGGVTDPWDQSWVSHQVLVCFWRDLPAGSSLEGIWVH